MYTFPDAVYYTIVTSPVMVHKWWCCPFPSHNS